MNKLFHLHQYQIINVAHLKITFAWESNLDKGSDETAITFQCTQCFKLTQKRLDGHVNSFLTESIANKRKKYG